MKIITNIKGLIAIVKIFNNKDKLTNFQQRYLIEIFESWKNQEIETLQLSIELIRIKKTILKEE